MSGKSLTLIACCPDGVVEAITEVAAICSSLMRSTKSLQGTRERSTVSLSLTIALYLSGLTEALIG